MEYKQQCLSEKPVCFLCGGENARMLKDHVRYGVKKQVFQCESCDFVYLWPRGGEEEVSDFYKEGFRNLPRASLGMAEHDPDDIFNSRLGQAGRRFNMVKPYIGKNASLLEIGCAAGSFISMVRPFVGECSAIELDHTFAEYVRNKFRITVFENPIEEMDLPAGTFDIICMWHVLEHLHDPVTAIRKLLGMLKERGTLFLEVPNIWDPLLTIYKIPEMREFYYQSPHLYYFSPVSLKETIDRAGGAVEIKPIQLYGLWNHIRWLTIKRPQSHQPAGKPGAFDVLDRTYRKLLENGSKTDTLFAVVRRK